MSFIGIKNLGLLRAIILFIVLVVYNLGSVSNSYSLERLDAERLIRNISEKVNGVISSSSSQELSLIHI